MKMINVRPPRLNTTLEEKEIIPVTINGRVICHIGNGQTIRVSKKYAESVAQIARDAGVMCAIEVIDSTPEKAPPAPKKESGNSSDPNAGKDQTSPPPPAPDYEGKKFPEEYTDEDLVSRAKDLKLAGNVGAWKRETLIEKIQAALPSQPE